MSGTIKETLKSEEVRPSVFILQTQMFHFQFSLYSQEVKVKKNFYSTKVIVWVNSFISGC